MRRSVLAALSVLIMTWAAVGFGVASAETLTVGAHAPEFTAEPWIGSPPLTIAGLRGRVTLVEFWTYG
jgi:hypothetical protein